MSVRTRLLPSLLALTLGAGTAGLVACGDGGDQSALLASTDAEELLDDLSSARDALAGGECTDAAQAVARARRTADGLPSSVDRRLRSRLREGLDALEGEIRPDCEEQTTVETVETTTTTAPVTPTEPVEEPEVETEPAPPETQPEATTPEPTPPAEEEPPVSPEEGDEEGGTGGVSPDGGEG